MIWRRRQSLYIHRTVQIQYWINLKPDSPDFAYTFISYFWIPDNNHPAGRYIASGRYITDRYIASEVYSLETFRRKAGGTVNDQLPKCFLTWSWNAQSEHQAMSLLKTADFYGIDILQQLIGICQICRTWCDPCRDTLLKASLCINLSVLFRVQ